MSDFEHRQPADLRDFLLQSSDEEDNGGDEPSDPQLDSEAEVMAYFYKNSTQQPDQTAQKYSKNKCIKCKINVSRITNI